MSLDSVFHGNPSSTVPSGGQASLGLDVTSGELYFRSPSNGAWEPTVGGISINPQVNTLSAGVPSSQLDPNIQSTATIFSGNIINNTTSFQPAVFGGVENVDGTTPGLVGVLGHIKVIDSATNNYTHFNAGVEGQAYSNFGTGVSAPNCRIVGVLGTASAEGPGGADTALCSFTAFGPTLPAGTKCGVGIGLDVEMNFGAYAGTVTTGVYGMLLTGPGSQYTGPMYAGISMDSFGTAAAINYGLLINNHTGVNNWGIYVTTATSFFGGAVTFGPAPSAPTSAATAGTQGEMIQHGGILYICSATGTAGHATWNAINVTAV
jgi:hypothetical protein